MISGCVDSPWLLYGSSTFCQKTSYGITNLPPTREAQVYNGTQVLTLCTCNKWCSKKPGAGVQLFLLNFLIVLDQSGLHGKFPLKFCPQQLVSNSLSPVCSLIFQYARRSYMLIASGVEGLLWRTLLLW